MEHNSTKFTHADIGRYVVPTEETLRLYPQRFNNEKYCILSVGDDLINVQNVNDGTISCGWFHYRFEFVKEYRFKPGDVVKIKYRGYNYDKFAEIVKFHKLNDKEQEAYLVKGINQELDLRGGELGECYGYVDGIKYLSMCEEFLDKAKLLEPAFIGCDYGNPGQCLTIVSGSGGQYDLAYKDVDDAMTNAEYTYSNSIGQSPKLTKSSLQRMYQLIYRGIEQRVYGNPWIKDSDNIIKTNLYKDMNIIDKIRVNIKGEPMKTLIKHDILTLDERLTRTGQELFNDFLYAKFKDEFVADLAPKLKDLKENE